VLNLTSAAIRANIEQPAQSPSAHRDFRRYPRQYRAAGARPKRSTWLPPLSAPTSSSRREAQAHTLTFAAVRANIVQPA
jgi:hypothetical protein